MIQKFIPTNWDQQYFFPPSIQDWLPEEHLARFVVDIVSQLDLRPLAETYAGKGFKEYHPEILLSLLFYGYATGIFSSRKIEKATYDSVAFRFISTNTHPDHDTIHTSARTHDDITVQACFENGGRSHDWYHDSIGRDQNVIDKKVLLITRCWNNGAIISVDNLELSII